MDNNAENIMVSATLITYNHEKYVAQAIESMLNQVTNFKYEILVADDCSTDKTQEILKKYKEKYPDRIKLFLRDKNLGATKNSFLLFNHTKGKYFTCLEGDDYWIDDNRLQYMVDFLENNKEYVCISHRREVRDINGNLIGYDPNNNLLNKPFTMKDFLKGKRYSSSGSLYVNFLKNSGDKYEKVKLASRNVGDYQTCMLLLDLGNVYITDKCFSAYRKRSHHKESNYNSITSIIDKYYDHINIIRAVNEFFSNKYNLSREIIKIQFAVILHCLKRKKFKELKEISKTITGKEKLMLIITFPFLIIKRLILRK